jgi:homoserine dehydrogenase
MMSVVQGLSDPSFVARERRRTIVVGVLGCGTVGGGVVARLLEQDRILGQPVRLARVLVRDLSKMRFPEGIGDSLTTCPAEVVDDPEVDIVVEAIGGIEVARSLVERALANGKHVVSANKALIATHGQALAELARRRHVALRYEAAVGGAVPVVRAITDSMAAEEIVEIAGVMNGTSNFIVGEMLLGGSFDDAVRSAQEAGYAEPDPSADVDGHDAAQKLTVLSRLGFRRGLDLAAIRRVSLRCLLPDDFPFAARLGYRIVPMAFARREGDRLTAVVAPMLTASDHDFARAQGPGNVIRVTGTASGPLQFSGAGAGRLATASAVFSDLADIVRKLARWEYQGAELLSAESIATESPRLGVVVRVAKGRAAAAQAALSVERCEARALADDAVACAPAELDETIARIERLGSEVIAWFPVLSS